MIIRQIYDNNVKQNEFPIVYFCFYFILFYFYFFKSNNVYYNDIILYVIDIDFLSISGQ